MRAMKTQERRCPISHGSQVASYACSLRMSSRSSDLRPGEATLRDTAAAPAFEPVRTLMRPRGAELVELAKPRLNLLVVVSTVVGYALGARAPVDYAGLAPTAVASAPRAFPVRVWSGMSRACCLSSSS